MQTKWQAVNKWGERIYKIPFKRFEDAKNFAKLIGRNYKRFSLIGCHRSEEGCEVVYRPRKEYLWQEGRN